MSKPELKMDPKPPQSPPRKIRRREPEPNLKAEPVNPPAVGGGGIQRGDGPKKK